MTMPSYLPLIAQWETYLAEGEAESLEHFALWILKNRQQSRQAGPALPDPDLQGYFDQNTAADGFGYLGSEAAYMIGRLYKFVRLYTKPVFQAAGLGSSDEFGILAHVDRCGECTKKSAIEDNLMDTTTGIDAIRRMIKKGLLEEKINEQDRRERLISITPAGKDALTKTYGGLASTQDVLADLGSEERQQLVNLLRTLDEFHSKMNGSGT